ncbi:MAG TPA: inositol monophosphatase family protein [Pyrinomonadaceae bacterium]|nr:inositol monophosphatase [Chloracidobacterium sp.]MBP9934643.1 inositol monophosphatase [Pyrinomonadaceae bacterium]MBK7804651.1 inositol monophosphatase [Chloracidobacterium sp.]MBL0240571.1 inositol monophosphatase [Chloracidobacterium sp.]HQX55817.1 inositol monophosphatase family protein [Pyrinomonadaceae bacterium]
MLNFAIETAREAGQILLEKFDRGIAVHKKGDIDLVTAADLASEALIIERIKSYYPRHSILAEESGNAVVIGGENTWKWIIDPLDGTTNFAHGYPCFCVTIALEHDGEIVIGVTFDPTRNELFAAERGGGASLNGKPIRVSNCEDLGDALIVTGFPYDIKHRNDFARHLTEMLLSSRGVRRDGSAAIDMAYVACGRFDGFWEEGLNPWDVAAGVLLIEEAGGQLSYYDGKPFSIYSPPICASNGLLHSQMLKVLS